MYAGQIADLADAFVVDESALTIRFWAVTIAKSKFGLGGFE